MAISDAFNGGVPQAKPSAPVQAPVAPAISGNKQLTKAQQAHNAFAKQGDAIAAQVDEATKALEGTKSDKVAFVQCLGDPTKPNKRVEEGSSINSYLVVGYAFKALEDMTVPNAPYKEGSKSPMDVEDMTEVPVKAGQVFYLNVFETGALISRPEYSGAFTGEGTTVKLGIKFSSDSPVPRPLLNKVGEGSIKANMDLIADVTDVDGKKIAKVKDQYADKFGVLFVKKTASRRAGSDTAKSRNTSKSLAYAFAAYINNKKA